MSLYFKSLASHRLATFEPTVQLIIDRSPPPTAPVAKALRLLEPRNTRVPGPTAKPYLRTPSISPPLDDAVTICIERIKQNLGRYRHVTSWRAMALRRRAGLLSLGLLLGVSSSCVAVQYLCKLFVVHYSSFRV